MVARINTWGGSTKDLTGFNATSGTCAVSTTVTRNGIASFRVNPTGVGTGYADLRGVNTALAPMDFGLSSSFGRTYCRFDTIPASASEEFLVLMDGASTRKLSLRVHSDGAISLWLPDGTTQIGSNSTALVVAGNSRWYQIEWFAESAGAASGVEIKLDGDVILGATGQSIGASLKFVLFGKVTNRNSQAVDIYYSDIAVEDAQYPGAGIIYPFIGNGVGAYDTWTTGAGSGSFWELTDDTPNDGISTYALSTLFPPDASTSSLPSASSAGIKGAVLSVKAIAICRRHAAATSTYAVRTRVNSFDYDGPGNASAGGTFTYRAYLMTLNPEDAAAFELADLDATEIGTAEASATQQTRVTSCLLSVECAPPSEMTGHGIGKAIAATVLATIGSLAGMGVSAGSAQADGMSVGVAQGLGVSVSAEHSALDLVGVLQGYGLGVSASRGDSFSTGSLTGAGAGASVARGAGDSVAALVGRGHGVSSERGTIDVVGVLIGTGSGPSAASGTASATGSLAGVGVSASTARAPADSVASLVGRGNSASGASGDLVGVPVLIGQGLSAGSAHALGTSTGSLTGQGLGIAGARGDGQSLGELVGYGLGISSQRGDISLGIEMTGYGLGASIGRGVGSYSVVVIAGFYEDTANRVRNSLAALVTLAPIHYDDAPFTSPAISPWVRGWVLFEETTQTQFGALNSYRAEGKVLAEIYVPIRDGDRDALRIADEIRAAFTGQTLTSVVYDVPQISSGTRDGAWWRIDCELAFHRDRTAAPVLVSSAFPGFEAIGNVARSRFKAEIADAYSIPTLYDNGPAITQTAPWVRLSVLVGAPTRVDRNPTSRRYRVRGLVVAQCFGEIKAGDQPLLELADRIDPVFRSTTDRGVTFATPSVKSIGRAGAWWQINVKCPFSSEFFV